MKKRIFRLLIVGIVFATVCYSAEELNCLPHGNGDEAMMCMELFKIDDDGKSQPMDFNSISGYVKVAIRNIPKEADKVFVYFDEVQIGKWVRGDNFTRGHFGFESNVFSNGRHRIKLVSITSDGEVTNYPPVDAYFKNLLYNVRCDDQFHPDKNYRYSGFYDGGKSLEVKVTGLHGNVIWSNVYSGSYIDINIPGSVFKKEQLCSLDVNEIQGGSKETNLNVSDSNEKPTRKGIEFFQADKYFVPPTDKTVSIMLYVPYGYGESDSCQPVALFGNEELTAKLMGKSLEPRMVFEGREWLEKIMDAYRTALKEAEEKKFHRDSWRHDVMLQIIFVTEEKGYIQHIDFDANTVYNNYMESSTLKEYFDELGLTKKSSSEESNEADSN